MIKIDELDKEIQRLRAANRRLERDQRAGSTVPDAPQVNPSHVTGLKILAITMGIVILILVLAWSCSIF